MPITQDKLLKVLSSGLLKFAGPEVIAGMLQEFIKPVTIKDMAIWVATDVRMWDRIPAGYQDQVKKFSHNLGNLDWLTAEWMINTVREKNPGVASLFINWPEALDYLKKQIIDIKEEIAKS